MRGGSVLSGKGGQVETCVECLRANLTENRLWLLDVTSDRVAIRLDESFTSQQTQNIFITFIQCRTNVEDVGPTLYK